MIVIDSLDMVSIVFDGGYTGVVSGLTLDIINKSTNKTETKTFNSILFSNERYIELEIDWVNTIENGNYYYKLKNSDNILDQGIMKVDLPSINLPIYKDDMDEYVVYKN